MVTAPGFWEKGLKNTTAFLDTKMGNKTLSPWVWLVFGSPKFTRKKVPGIKVCPEKYSFP